MKKTTSYSLSISGLIEVEKEKQTVCTKWQDYVSSKNRCHVFKFHHLPDISIETNVIKLKTDLRGMIIDADISSPSLEPDGKDIKIEASLD